MPTDEIVVLPLKRPEQPCEVNIVVVPDFAKDGTRSENTHGWVDSVMPLDGAQAQILRFDYQVSLNTFSIWRQLSDKGEELLRILRRGATIYKLLERPLVLIGYGLGGFIVKRAISILSDPAIPIDPFMQVSNNDFLNMMSGVVFFGSPHIRTTQPEHWCRLTQLLHFAARLPKRFLAQSEADANVAALMCQDFEQSGFGSTVLSIYELKPTKVRSNLWSLKDTPMLIDKSLAETWVTKEKLIGNDTTHDAVGSFPAGSAIHQEVGLLLRSALTMHTRRRTASAIQGINPADLELWEDSVSYVSNNAPPPGNLGSQASASRRHDSSANANFGSSLPSHFDVIPSNDVSDYVQDELEASAWPCHLWEGFSEKHGFLGRNDIFQSIDDSFFGSVLGESADTGFHNPKSLPCCCISGLGGMGKTSTAIQYAMARRDRFDAIFVVKADNSAKLSEAFYKIPSALGLLGSAETRLKPDEDAGLVVNRNKAMKWLSEPKFSTSALDQKSKSPAENPLKTTINWLLIFDNVENSSILRDYWPKGDVGCILVTTRDSRNGNYLRSHSRVMQIYLDKLDTPTASDLLMRKSYININPENVRDASAIAERLGGLPLAIEQVAAYISTKGMTLHEFLTLYERTLLSRPSSDAADATENWSHQIATSWAMESLSTAAAALIQICSFVDPDGIEDKILIQGNMTALLEEGPSDEMVYIDARGELLKSSLIRVDTNITPVVIRMHRLVQDIVVALMPVDKRNQNFKFMTTVLYNAWEFTENAWDHQDQNWTGHETLLPHIIRLASIASTNELGDIELPTKRKLVALLADSGWYRQERGDFDTGIPLFELGIKICDSLPDDLLDLRGDLSFVLTNATCDTNRWSESHMHAQEHLDSRLRFDVARENLPSSKTCIAFSSLGLTLMLIKEYEEAIRNCDKSIELYADQPEVMSGSFHPAFPYIHRGLACVGAGRPIDGEQGLLDLIAWHETRFGPTRTEFKLGYAWHVLGLIYAHANRGAASVDAYSKALTHYKATVGLVYHRTGNVSGKLAEHHEALNQFEAADFYSSMAQEAYSSQHHHKPELARHYFIRSEAFKRRGDQEAAKTALRTAQDLYNEIMPHARREPLSLIVLNKTVAPWVW